MQTLSILIVDDEPNIRKTLSISLEAEGHQVRAVSNTKDALSEGDRSHFDLALVDGDLVSLEVIEEMHIRRILAATRSIEEACRVLGMDSVTLWRRRKKYGI